MDVLTVLKSQWDRVAAVGCVLGGVVLLVLGYRGIADSPYVAQELAYLISGGLGGVFLLGVGATLYISADMHDEWRKLDRIEEAILRLDPNAGGPDAGDRSQFTDIVAPVAQARADRNGKTGASAGRALRQADGARSARAERSVPTIAAMPRELLQGLRAGAVAMTLALVGLVIAHYRAADVAEAGPAFTATAAAATVLAVAGVVAILGTVDQRRRLMRRRAVLLSGFAPRVAGRGRNAEPGASLGQRPARMPERLHVIADGRYAHVEGCAMLAGERTHSVASAALPEGIVPCALCTPAGL